MGRRPAYWSSKRKEKMERDLQRDELKKFLPDYVRRITRPDPKAGKGKYVCPLCRSGDHGAGSTGAFSIKADGTTWHCFSCGRGGDLFDLIGLYENLTDYNDQFDRAAELFGMPRKEMKPMETKMETPKADFSEMIARCAAAASETDYFAKRGFTAETVTRFHLGYDATSRNIVIPYDGTSYYITRNIDRKEFRKPSAEIAGPEPVFHAEAFYTGEPVFVCESQLDALSIIQAGGMAAAIGGTGATKLTELLKAKRPTGTVILCFDNDDAGEKTAETVAAALSDLKITFIKAKFDLDKYAEHKDANDLLISNADQLRRDIRKNIRAARKATGGFTEINVGEYVSTDDFGEDLKFFKKYKDRKTGFENIDQYMTLYPGLCALGGNASLGKTTFAVNLADNLLKAGEAVLYFALEQDPIELVTKCLARRLVEENPFTMLTNIDIKNGATDMDLTSVKKKFSGDAKLFTIVRGDFSMTAEDIRDYVEAYIERTGRRPIVIIDYLQLVSVPDKFRGDTRAALDHVIKVLKAMQVENELFVLIVSSFNRGNYSTPVGYESFKETGLIEYGCDFIWGLQLAILDSEDMGDKTAKECRDAINAANSQNPKQVELVSLKNRNGRQTFKAFFKFDMTHDSFTPDLTIRYADPQPTAKASKPKSIK